MSRKDPDIKFANLHSHTTFSMFDGLGYPEDHLEFIWENGMDHYTVTDHGTMAAMPYQIKAIQRFREDGKDVKPIYGVEAYVIPSLDEWRTLYKKKQEGAQEEINATIVEGEDTKKAIDNKLKERRHMLLLAQNLEGLHNIFKLVSDSYLEENFYYFPRMDYEMLDEHSEGVIATTSCLGGIFAGDYWQYKDDGRDDVLSAMRDTADTMQDIYGDRIYAEVQWNEIEEQHQLNKCVIEVADEKGMELVTNADAHYPRPELWQSRELYKQLGWLGEDNPENMKQNLPSGKSDLDVELYPKNGDEIFKVYKRTSQKIGYDYDDDLIRDSIERTYHIADNRIEDFYPDTSPKLPDFVEPEAQTAAEKLRELAEDGLHTRKGGKLAWDKKYLQRLDRELEVIKSRGFSKYFLAMKRIVDEGKSKFLFGPARGSAAGALTSYLIGITQVDPIEHDLLFSRFLQKDQDGYPDIDLDVSDRDALREHMVDLWGEDAVAAVSNYNTLQIKSLIKDLARFEGMDFGEANEITSKVMDEAVPKAKEANNIKAGKYTPTFEEVKKFSPTFRKFLNEHPDVKGHLKALLDQVKSVGKHAGGLVILENLDEKMPLITSGDTRQTPWTEGARRKDLEPLGFIKFDLLGLKTLSIFEDCIANILRRRGKDPSFENIKEFYDEKMHPDKLNLNIDEVYENVFQDGKWAGIFQFTQEGMQQLCEKIKPSNIEEIATVMSIYRPGPLSAGVDEDYLRAKNNPHTIDYEHPKMKEVTEETYGFLLFQEQIAQAAHKLGKDISLDEGNLLRETITKRGVSPEKKKKRENLRERFLEGCQENGMSEGDAKDLYKKFEYFSGYGFNKSHAISYSIIAYQCAWLLTYYEPEWMAAYLEQEAEKSTDAKERAISIAESFGFEVQLPDINSSLDTWQVSEDDEKKLLQPLTDIKGVGDTAYEQILEHRPFDKVEELILNEDIDYRPLNKAVVGKMTRATVLDDLMDERFENRKHMWHCISDDNPDNEKQLKENVEEYSGVDDFTRGEYIESITNLAGVYPIDSVISDRVHRKLNELNVPPVGMMDPVEEGKNLCWFVVKEVTLKTTRSGNRPYWVLTLTDETKEETHMKIWGAKQDDPLYKHHTYMADLDYDPKWGYSVQGMHGNMKLIGS